MKVLRLQHGVNGDFANPCSYDESVFWQCIVVKGTIDVPKSLKGVLSSLRSKSIYDFKELLINKKSVNFGKKIEFNKEDPNKVEFIVTCSRRAKPGKTYHISYVEEGLYDYSHDFYEFESRTSLKTEVVAVEKPRELELSASPWGEAALNILKDSSKLYSFEVLNNGANGSGFSLRWDEDSMIRRKSRKDPSEISKEEKDLGIKGWIEGP